MKPFTRTPGVVVIGLPRRIKADQHGRKRGRIRRRLVVRFYKRLATRYAAWDAARRAKEGNQMTDDERLDAMRQLAQRGYCNENTTADVLWLLDRLAQAQAEIAGLRTARDEARHERDMLQERLLRPFPPV